MISHIKGTVVTNLVGTHPKIILHCCNDVGQFSGVAEELAQKWPRAKDCYLAWYCNDESMLAHEVSGVEVTGRLGLGESQIVKVEPGLWVVNTIGQHGMGIGGGSRASIRYDAFRKGLQATARWASIHKASVHMPKLGLSVGGHWGNIEAMISIEIANRGVEVHVYDLASH
jgi:hypothetical protein